MTAGDPGPSLRVLIVLTSNARRGAEIEGSELGRHLQAVGVDAEVVCLAPTVGSSVLDVRALGRRPLGLSTLRALRRSARTRDLVIAYGSSTLPGCALALVGSGVPFVYRSIGDPAAWVRAGVHRWRTGLLMRRASHVVALWPGAADNIRLLYGIDADRVSVIPNARSSEEFRPPTAEQRTAARTRFGLPIDGNVVGCVGSISAEKRVGLAVDAVAELDDLHLLVVGDGPERADVQRHATTALGARVTFTGVIDDVIETYWAMDTLLLPSATEGMPGVVIEAAMCGVPVVATDVGAVRSMVDGGIDGEVVRADTPARELPRELARELASCLSHSLRTRTVPVPTNGFEWSSVVGSWSAVLGRYG
jgi:glycosyltransferase involved in cell wall biosynthesis